MTDAEILAVVLREMEAYGYGWRLNWSGFDGRQLLSQLNGIAKWAERARAGESSDFREGTEFSERQAKW